MATIEWLLFLRWRMACFFLLAARDLMTMRMSYICQYPDLNGSQIDGDIDKDKMRIGKERHTITILLTITLPLTSST